MPLAGYVDARDVRKSYDNSGPVLAGVSLEVSQGEFIVFLGPNGCGKTTLLKILAGLDNQYEGYVSVGGNPPAQANVGIVPQHSDDALLPWRNVVDNIGLPLEAHRHPVRERRQIVNKFIEQIGVKLPLKAYPYQMSGGQKQLAAIMRALIADPDILLLDEPLAALDFENMLIMQESLLKLWHVTHTTTFLVTHDLLSAVYLADRILVFTPRPSRVSVVLAVDLPRPRERQDPRLVRLLDDLQHACLMWSK